VAVNLRTDDASVAKVLASLHAQIESMARSASGVEDVNHEIRQHFQAAASTAYQSKIEDWHQQYRNVMEAYRHLVETLQHGHHVIDMAHDDASTLAGGWSNDVYSALNG
jgi:uncharacterized protein YukE